MCQGVCLDLSEGVVAVGLNGGGEERKCIKNSSEFGLSAINKFIFVLFMVSNIAFTLICFCASFLRFVLFNEHAGTHGRWCCSLGGS